ncbi:MAG: Hsp20/alpha crystallin family protein [Firmicutes bacterium]|nr:Hsp20/alpha crystallin family protein [Bacillota bacterium]
MDGLQPWEAFTELFPMSRFFDQGFWQPSVDVVERAGEFIVRANLPGMKREDIELTVDENSLTLQGEIREEKTAEDERFYRRERRRGSFIRRIPLRVPVRAEAVKAAFNDGVLEVRLPKVEPAIPQGRRIEIQ